MKIHTKKFMVFTSSWGSCKIGLLWLYQKRKIFTRFFTRKTIFWKTAWQIFLCRYKNINGDNNNPVMRVVCLLDPRFGWHFRANNDTTMSYDDEKWLYRSNVLWPNNPRLNHIHYLYSWSLVVIIRIISFRLN